MSYLFQHTQILQAISVRVDYCVRQMKDAILAMFTSIEDKMHNANNRYDQLAAVCTALQRRVNELELDVDLFKHAHITNIGRLDRTRRDANQAFDMRIQQLEQRMATAEEELERKQERIEELEYRATELEDAFHDEVMDSDEDAKQIQQ